MPLAFVSGSSSYKAILLNPEERNFVSFVDMMDRKSGPSESPYAVTISVDVFFTKSRARDGLGVQTSDAPGATPICLTEEQVRDKYPLDYATLTARCAKRYADFKVNGRYHDLRKALAANTKYAMVRYLDPGNPKSPKKVFFSEAVFRELDKSYSAK